MCLSGRITAHRLFISPHYPDGRICRRRIPGTRTGGSQSAFTLIELLLVLSIVALLLALSPALMQKAFPILKLKAAARDMVQEIRYVQNAAIINGQVAEIRFDLKNGEYRSDLVNGGEVRALPSGLSFSNSPQFPEFGASEEMTRFVFYPDGSANGGVLFVGNDRKRMAIRVDWLTSKIQLDELHETKRL
ncbi:MAG: prepilin-type N-terminal cleavage/methylation domain-containing protein [Candidatus Thiodiazotropha sp.]